MRKKIVAGNWKMNNSLQEGLKLTSEIVNMAQDELGGSVELILNPPYLYLKPVLDLVAGSKNISIGAQNCHQETSGAYTGEVSAPMLKSMGVKYVILGHSERREYFNETDELLAAKVNIVLAQGLKPIFCCGEPLEIRNAGSQQVYVTQQITNGLFHLSVEQFSQIVIAYEPIWAIGTGLTASKEQAQEMHKTIRNHIASKYGSEVAESTSILYGGSAKPSNAKELFSCEDVDGGLIGGASLKSRDFIDIAKSF